MLSVIELQQKEQIINQLHIFCEKQYCDESKKKSSTKIDFTNKKYDKLFISFVYKNLDSMWQTILKKK